MITNSEAREYDVIEVTNEMPVNRKGGVGSVIENLASGFRSLGVKALWFMLDHNYRDFEVERILAEFPDITIGSYNELSLFKAPIFHLHIYQHDPLLLQYILSKKAVLTIHSLLVCEAQSNGIDLSRSIRQQETLITACNKVVLVSHSELQNYYKYSYHKLNPNVTVIHNGLRDRGSYKEQHNNKIIGYCGRLVPRKRPEYVQMVLTEKGFSNYSVMIAGRGFSHYARNLLLDLKIQDRGRFLGWCGRDRLESFYNAIDLMAIPSTYEPFGMIALEAVIRGIPIVCNRVGGLSEILGDYAFYSENDTYESFREAMKMWLKADREKIKAITRGALQRYYQSFTDIIMAQKYLNLFRNFA